MKGYAILKKEESLKLLCLRGGYLIDDIMDFKNLKGELVSNYIREELKKPTLPLRLEDNEEYYLYEVKLKKSALILTWIFNFFRHSIEGVLVTYKK